MYLSEIFIQSITIKVYAAIYRFRTYEIFSKPYKKCINETRYYCDACPHFNIDNIHNNCNIYFEIEADNFAFEHIPKIWLRLQTEINSDITKTLEKP